MSKPIATSGETKRLMAKHNFHIKKSLGQNFIIQPSIIDSIVRAAGIDEEDIVVEIGPGMGSLTQGLAETAGQVLAVELDYTLIPILRETFAGYENVTIQQGDAMKVDFNALLQPLREKGAYRPGFVVVANLPYYITTPITMGLLEGPTPWRRLVLMVQKEVAERMRAKPGTKDYGALSIGVQYRANAKIALHIPPSVFIPRPAVDSAVVVLDRLEQPAVTVQEEKIFFRVVGAAFGQRRKTLLNALSNGLHVEKDVLNQVLATAGIEASRRGETLSLAEFAALADGLVATKAL